MAEAGAAATDGPQRDRREGGTLGFVDCSVHGDAILAARAGDCCPVVSTVAERGRAP